MIRRSFKPFDPNLLNVFLSVQPNDPFRLKSRENSRIEFKESFNLGSRDEYARTMAAFANASGGYLVFGVTNSPRTIVGLRSQNFEEFDPEKLTEFLNSLFSPQIEWDLHTHELSGKKLGLLYTWELVEKPAICTRNGGDKLKEADIYYRYRGRSERIKYPELVAVLRANRERERDLWRGHLERISKIGPSNAGIMDVSSGEVSGPGGSFIISEGLLSKLSFIKEGTFHEKVGAPTLKLIGDVKAISDGAIAPIEIVVQHQALVASDVIIHFLEQRRTEDPLAYVRVICSSATAFLPVYWYIDKSGKTVEEVIKEIEQIPARNPSRGKLIDRLQGTDRANDGSVTVESQSAKTRLAHLGRMRAGEADVDRANLMDLRCFFQAITHLEPGECDLRPVMKLLLDIFRNSYTGMGGNESNLLRRAICHIDRISYEAIRQEVQLPVDANRSAH